MNLPPTSFEFNGRDVVIEWSWEPVVPRYDDPYMLLKPTQTHEIRNAYRLATAYARHVVKIKELQHFPRIDHVDCRVQGVRVLERETFSY